jgi:hypothetical protein
VETLYLLCVLLSLFDQQRMGNGGGVGVALRWGLLHGLLCLLRAEHVLAFLAFLFVAWRTGARVRVLLLAVAASAVVLVPWQVHGNRQVAAFNAGPQPPPPLPPSALPWDADAVAAVRALPAFQQGPVHQFVTETVRVRGGTRVRAEDLGIVREAYGVHPEPLRPAFVALQGAMDFWLGNTPEAAGGFSRKALDRPPQLLGGESRYPPGLLGVLPRGGKFSLNYPPHLDAFVNGYRRGFAEIAADPVAAAGRVVQKVWYALEGATGGIGGHALPIGLSGVRRPVDMVTATGTWPFVWRVLVLGVAAAGLWRLRRVPVLWPLLAFAAVRLVVVAAFFGYARQGALCLPVVAIGVASAMTAVLARRIAGRTAMWLGLVFAVGLCVVEIVRANTASVAVDGRPWLGSAGGQAQFEPHTITFR